MMPRAPQIVWQVVVLLLACGFAVAQGQPPWVPDLTGKYLGPGTCTTSCADIPILAELRISVVGFVPETDGSAAQPAKIIQVRFRYDAFNRQFSELALESGAPSNEETISLPPPMVILKVETREEDSLHWMKFTMWNFDANRTDEREFGDHTYHTESRGSLRVFEGSLQNPIMELLQGDSASGEPKISGVKRLDVFAGRECTACPQVCRGPCGAGEEEAAPCGQDLRDRDCRPCPVGSFNSEPSICVPCHVCGAGEEETTSCTWTTNRQCAPCASGSYLSGDGTCMACRACGAGEEETTSCTSTTNRQCAPCASGSYLSGDGTCMACRGACGAGEEEITSCKSTTNRVCEAQISDQMQLIGMSAKAFKASAQKVFCSAVTETLGKRPEDCRVTSFSEVVTTSSRRLFGAETSLRVNYVIVGFSSAGEATSAAKTLSASGDVTAVSQRIIVLLQAHPAFKKLTGLVISTSSSAPAVSAPPAPPPRSYTASNITGAVVGGTMALGLVLAFIYFFFITKRGASSKVETALKGSEDSDSEEA